MKVLNFCLLIFTLFLMQSVQAEELSQKEAGPQILSPRFVPLPQTDEPQQAPIVAKKTSNPQTPDGEPEADEVKKEDENLSEDEPEAQDESCEMISGTIQVPGTSGCQISFAKCGNKCELGSVTGNSQVTETSSHYVTAANGCVEFSYQKIDTYNECSGQLMGSSIQVGSVNISQGCVPDPDQFEEVVSPGLCADDLAQKISPSSVQIESSQNGISVRWSNGCNVPKGPDSFTAASSSDRSPVQYSGGCPSS